MDFETLLQKELVRQYLGAILKIKEENKVVQEQAKSIEKEHFREKYPEKIEKAEALIMEYVKENTVRIVDPLNIKESAREAEEKQKQLLKELDRRERSSFPMQLHTLKFKAHKEVITVSEKMLLTQALDERDSLKEEIQTHRKYVQLLCRCDP